MIQLNYAGLLTSGNVRALLRVLREGESSQAETAYRLRYHPTIFPCFFDGDVHPRIFELLPDGSGRKSSAAGAYQFTATTWDDINEEYGLPDDMSAYSQDCHAVALIHKLGALDLIIDGRWERAVVLCSQRWASLPNSPLQDGGRKMSWDLVRKVYEQYGGSGPTTTPSVPYGDEQPPAPIEERSINSEVQSMGPALLIPLLTSLAEVFSPLLRGKLTQALDKQVKDPAMSQQMAGQIMDIVKQAAAQSGMVPASPTAYTSAPASTPSTPVYTPPSTVDPVVAVGIVKGSPTLTQQVEQQLSDYFDRMAPIIDRMEKLEQSAWAASEESMDRASARAKNETFDTGPVLLFAAVIGVGLVTLFVGAAIAVQLWQGKPVGTEVWAALTGLIGWITAKAGTIYDYRFGSSRNSQTKDFAIAELSMRKPS